jgi:hypothetical protein
MSIKNFSNHLKILFNMIGKLFDRVNKGITNDHIVIRINPL